MTSTDYLCQEKKEEVDFPAFNITWIHQYDRKTKYKRTKEN